LIFLTGIFGSHSIHTQQGAEWTLIDQFPYLMYDIFFVDNFNGYIVGSSDEAIILKTTDGGMHWDNVTQNITSDNILSIYCMNKDTLVICGSGSSSQADYFKTTNGGNTWVHTLNWGMPAWDMDFVDQQTGIAPFGALGPTYIMKSTDGGSTWNSSGMFAGNSSTFIGPIECQMIDRYVWYIVLDDGRVMKTADGGSSWQQKYQASPGYGMRGLTFLNADTGWAVGRTEGYWLGGFTIRTSDGGNTWHKVDLNNERGNDIAMISEYLGYTICYSGAILKTVDGGNTWNVDTVFFSGAGIKIFFPTPDVGYCLMGGGSSSSLYKIDFTTGIPEKERAMSLSIGLYPNPTTDILRITINNVTSSDGILTVRLFDSIGFEKYAPVKPNKDSEMEMDLSELRNGLYYLEVTSTSHNRTAGKFLKL
jgi:photosystem II stability/assembly factor-like uncharacterized protein